MYLDSGGGARVAWQKAMVNFAADFHGPQANGRSQLHVFGPVDISSNQIFPLV